MSKLVAEKIVKSLREHGFKLKPILVADEIKIHNIVQEQINPLEEDLRFAKDAFAWEAQERKKTKKQIAMLKEALEDARQNIDAYLTIGCEDDGMFKCLERIEEVLEITKEEE